MNKLDRTQYYYTKRYEESHPGYGNRRRNSKPYYSPDALCPYCNKPIIKPQVDHVIPTTIGGSDEDDNLGYCCKSCNNSKGNKQLIIWLAYRPASNVERYLRRFA